MCYTIKSENLLANYFANNPDQPKIEISELRELRKFIEKQLSPYANVDISKDSLAYAEQSNPDTFVIEDDFIELTETARIRLRDYGYLENSFNWRIPVQLKERYTDLIKKYHK